MAKKGDKMTEKQKLFSDLYLTHGDGTKAYREAYDCSNDTTARTNAHKNLQKPIIKNYIDERIKNLDNKRIASADEVLEFFSGVMRGEIRDQFDLDPSLGDRINAGKELAKRYGLDKKTEEKKKERIQVVICSADDEEDDEDDED